ncbi:MAG: hypothetical protein AAB390_03715 [Patescibacteria group bacterium]
MVKLKKLTVATITLSLLTLAFLSSGNALAQGIGGAQGNLDAITAKSGAQTGELSTLIGNIINVVLSLVGIIFLILMVYAGVLWMTSRGEEEQIGRAHKIIYSSLIGLVITVAAYAITVFVTGKFEK